MIPLLSIWIFVSSINCLSSFVLIFSHAVTKTLCLLSCSISFFIFSLSCEIFFFICSFIFKACNFFSSSINFSFSTFLRYLSKSFPLKASILLTPDATEDSLTISKLPISFVLFTCVPPHSSML